MVVLVGTVLTPSASASTGDTKLLQGGVVVTANDPHLTGCTFTIQWNNFSTPTVTYRLEEAGGAAPPILIETGVVTLTAGAGQQVINFNPTNLAALSPHPIQGYHITLVGDSTDPNAPGKNKTFWIEKACGATTGTLIIDKVATPTNASQTEPFAFSDNITPGGSVGNVTPDTNETFTVTAGTFSVTENNLSAAQILAGWTKGSASCSDGSPVTAIAVGVGETVTCTYNNSFVAPATTGTLIIDKVVSGIGASQTEPFAFTDNITGQDVGTVTAATNETFTVTAGTYRVTEDALTVTQGANGWTMGTASCSDNSPVTAIVVGVGETVTCTYNNSFLAPPNSGTLIIDKVATGTGASQTEPFAFSDTMNPQDVGTVTPDTNETFTLTAGTYSVTEDNLSAAQTAAGWTKGTASCSDNSPVTAIDVGVGETVTCTYNNSFVAPIVPPPLVPDLAITKTGTPLSIPVGGTATYTLTVTNTGTGPATNVVVTDSMPAGLGFVSSTPGAPTCTNSHDLLLGTDTLTCQLGTLAAGDQTSVSIVVSGLFAGTFTNTAVVGPTDATPDDNTDSADTVVTPVEVRPDEVLPSNDEKNEPKVLGERQHALPFTGLDVTRLGGVGVGMLLMGGLILLFDLRKRRVTGLG